MEREISIEIEKSWKEELRDTLESKDFKTLAEFVKKRYGESDVYPEAKNIFRVLNLTPLKDVRVVILGQDPYHGS